MTNLRQYFEKRQGLGILSTADGNGVVNSAVYARPDVLDETRLSFIMADRLSYANLRTNPRAAYLFREIGSDYEGVRLQLTKLSETTHEDALDRARRKQNSDACPADELPRHKVTFRIDAVRPLVGDDESQLPT